MSRLRCIRPPLAPAPLATGWKPDKIRGSRQLRGYGAAWDRTRKRILDRDEGLCQPCMREGRTAVGTQVDHITPKSRGGSDDDANLQTICVACHATKTARESGGGWSSENGASG